MYRNRSHGKEYIFALNEKKNSPVAEDQNDERQQHHGLLLLLLLSLLYGCVSINKNRLLYQLPQSMLVQNLWLSSNEFHLYAKL